MKILLITSLAIFSISAFGNELDDKKKMMNEYLDKKIALIQEAKSCINDADSKDEVKECKKSMKSEMKEMKKEKKEKKKKK